MQVVLGPKAASYALLAAAGLVAGLAAHRPELVALGAPFAVALVAGLRAVHRPQLSATVALSEERAVEGDDVAVVWQLQAARPLGRVELTAALPRGLAPVDPGGVVRADVDDAGTTTVRQGIRCVRWGRWPITTLAWQVLDPGRMATWEGTVEAALAVQVHPTPEELRRIVTPRHTGLSTGVHTARESGEGIEFAEIRPFHPGERARGINWRATARHGGELWVNRQHLERHADVVLLVDTLTEEALTPAVRAALRLADAYAGQRDRIGVVSFGGTLRWVATGTGVRHLYRVFDALLLSQTAFSYIWANPGVLPPRALPAAALVVAISPLDDQRTVDTLCDLRRRGIDLVVLEVATPARTVPGPSRGEQLAHRLWMAQREAQRQELRNLGAAVVAWSDEQPLGAALEEMTAFRRRHRRGA